MYHDTPISNVSDILFYYYEAPLFSDTPDVRLKLLRLLGMYIQKKDGMRRQTKEEGEEEKSKKESNSHVFFFLFFFQQREHMEAWLRCSKLSSRQRSWSTLHLLFILNQSCSELKVISYLSHYFSCPLLGLTFSPSPPSSFSLLHLSRFPDVN